MATTQSPVSTGRINWQIDPAHTLVEFAVKHMMIATVKGRFTDVRGTITTEGEDFTTAQVHIEIASASVDTRDEKRDAHLRSADFLDVERYPSIVFEGRRVERTDDGEYRLHGELTIRDVTRPVVLEVTPEGRAKSPWGTEVAGFSATAKLDRTAYGLTWNVALETGGILVANEVKLSIEAELIRQG